jgi:tRNA-specific 2-thiouridylase
MKKKIVFVGLSGGVDSAVSATLLKKQGYEVVGIFIKTWHPEFLICNEEQERMDAMRVAAHLDIPFLTFDLEDVYKKEVADYMIREYKAGRTPNPDVMCNKEVKFGAFLKKALAMGADYVATGHYAQTSEAGVPDVGILQGRSPTSGTMHLKKGVDPTKDQSYFLWTLKQKQLSKIIFPIGNLKKTEVRKLARKFNLPVALKKDSQGICFLGAVDLKEFLKHYIKSKKGKVLNEKGEEIGYHDGAVFYTLGERHGFTITKKSPTDGAYYVIGKDIKKNILVVSQKVPDVGYREDVGIPQGGSPTSIIKHLEQTKWILARQFKGGFEIPKAGKKYTAQIRYHGEFFDCRIKILPKDKAEVIFDKFVQVAPGQSCVVYDGNICLGGGVVV